MLIPRESIVTCSLCGKTDRQDYFILFDTTGDGELIEWKCDPPCQPNMLHVEAKRQDRRLAA